MEQQENIVSLVDWLNFTVRSSDLQDGYRVLGMQEIDFQAYDSGMYGYTKERRCGDIRMFYGGHNEDMGIHVQLSGKACRQYEAHHAEGEGWEPLFLRLVQFNANVSRFDLAVDEKRYHEEKPIWTIRQMSRKLKRGETKSKMKKSLRMETISIADGKSKGETLYIGSSSSDLQIRVYQKNHEREAAGQELEEGLTHWNRLEFQLRDERAKDAIFAVLAGIPSGELIYGLLANYLDF